MHHDNEIANEMIDNWIYSGRRIIFCQFSVTSTISKVGFQTVLKTDLRPIRTPCMTRTMGCGYNGSVYDEYLFEMYGGSCHVFCL